MDTNRLSPDQIERLLDLVQEQYGKVSKGEVSGYGQSQADELNDLYQTHAALRAMRDS
jgi:hypothetical protein